MARALLNVYINVSGPYGVNHGIEIQPDVVDYAYEKLEQFKTTCSGVDVFEFCEPYFIVGTIAC